MADATVEQIADHLYVSPGDVETVLRTLVGELPDVISHDLSDEVQDILDPWPLVRRVPDRYRLEDPPVGD